MIARARDNKLRCMLKTEFDALSVTARTDTVPRRQYLDASVPKIDTWPVDHQFDRSDHIESDETITARGVKDRDAGTIDSDSEILGTFGILLPCPGRHPECAHRYRRHKGSAIHVSPFL
jgi:hypothetical protein